MVTSAIAVLFKDGISATIGAGSNAALEQFFDTTSTWFYSGSRWV